jgi:hypothetical protein
MKMTKRKNQTIIPRRGTILVLNGILERKDYILTRNRFIDRIYPGEEYYYDYYLKSFVPTKLRYIVNELKEKPKPKLDLFGFPKEQTCKTSQKSKS